MKLMTGQNELVVNVDTLENVVADWFNNNTLVGSHKLAEFLGLVKETGDFRFRITDGDVPKKAKK